jgi:hypothetical protein
MKFFFPDSQDQVDPSFDMSTEERSIHRLRQRDDLYAHEALSGRPYDGILVSMPMGEGTTAGTSRYTVAQRHRLHRCGVHRFLRLDLPNGRPLEAMGDCGAFSYVREEAPPVTPDEVIGFYEGAGFDYGCSVDHVILAYDADADTNQLTDPQWVNRQQITIDLAAEFLRRYRARRYRFTPIGVAQGWSPGSYAYAVIQLQRIGYDRIGLGGMVPLKTYQIMACLRAIADVRKPTTQFHLLGVTRTEHLADFSGFGVTSFDSTSPFRRAFKDDRDNYWTAERTYTAIRVPQVDGNTRLKRRIGAGLVDQAEALATERSCLDSLNAFDVGEATVEETTGAIAAYDEVWNPGGHSRIDVYREFLDSSPWKTCPCGICDKVGIHVGIFRGSERNKRRGFHNIFVFNRTLQEEIEKRDRSITD